MTFLNSAEASERAAGKLMGDLPLLKPVTQEEVDNLGKFVAVTDELSHEPLLSPDSHDTISVSKNASEPAYGRLGHPAFLKSAILPFRKIWMRGEPCNYEAVRDFVYGLFEKNPLLEGYRYWFYVDYERQLAEKKFDLPNMGTVNQILDIWIHTQGAHSGKSRKGKGVQGNFSLTDFDDVVRKIGRAKFEFEFRKTLKCVGDTYVRFSKTLVTPLFERLQKNGLQPGFEVVAALRNSAYPKKADRIKMSDHFWHLDKETPEQTFDRLIERREFSDLSAFF